MNGKSNNIYFNVLTDANSILRILNEFSNTLDSLKKGQEFRRNMAIKFSQNAKFLTINRDEEGVLGFAAFYCNDFNSFTAYLSMIAIKSEFRKLGHGKHLFDKIVDVSLQNHMQTIKLEVNRKNISALSFYKSLGFEEDSEGTDSIYLNKHIM